MADNRIEKDGWCIKKYDDSFYLEYYPERIEESGGCYIVNRKMYDEVKNSAITLEQLIEKYDIFNKFEIFYTTTKGVVGTRPPNTDTYYNNGSYIVTDEDGEYFIEYQLSRQGGGIRRFKINKQIYEDARSNDYATSELFIKYNLYQFDIPENDVK